MILMIALVGVLIVCLVFQIVIRPVITDYDEASDKVDSLQQKYDRLLSKQLDYGLYQVEYADLLKQSETIVGGLMAPTGEDALDKLITKLVLASGLTVNALSIEPAPAHNIVYVPEDDSAEEQPYETGITQCDLTYQVQGTYSQILALRDAVMRDTAMCVTRLDFSPVTGTSEEAPEDPLAPVSITKNSRYDATFVISVYMYAPVETGELELTDETEAASDKNTDLVDELSGS